VKSPKGHRTYRSDKYLSNSI